MSIFSNIKYHRLGKEYEFANKEGKIITGIPVKVSIETDFIDENNNDESIIYLVKCEGNVFFNVDHETNREI